VIRSRIISTGSFLPEKVLTNHDLEKIVDTSDEWIIERTGIKERRIASENQAASDLAYEASKVALERAVLKAKDLDLIIAATVTGDMPFPSTACILQDKLGAKKAAAFDINAACSVSFMDSIVLMVSYDQECIKGSLLLAQRCSQKLPTGMIGPPVSSLVMVLVQ
jgi:3-oxoacyl-[acyl-carrier-protein] synthase-3